VHWWSAKLSFCSESAPPVRSRSSTSAPVPQRRAALVVERGPAGELASVWHERDSLPPRCSGRRGTVVNARSTGRQRHGDRSAHQVSKGSPSADCCGTGGRSVASAAKIYLLPDYPRSHGPAVGSGKNLPRIVAGRCAKPRPKCHLAIGRPWCLCQRGGGRSGRTDWALARSF